MARVEHVLYIGLTKKFIHVFPCYRKTQTIFLTKPILGILHVAALSVQSFVDLMNKSLP